MRAAGSKRLRYEVRHDAKWTYVDFYFNGGTNIVGVALPQALALRLSKDLAADHPMPLPVHAPRQRK